MVVWNDGSGSNKAIVSAVDHALGTFRANFYEAAGSAELQLFLLILMLLYSFMDQSLIRVNSGMSQSLEADDFIFDNNPIILRTLTK